MSLSVASDPKQHCAPTELSFVSWLSGYKHFAATRLMTLRDQRVDDLWPEQQVSLPDATSVVIERSI